jgi:hypothetical protein
MGNSEYKPVSVGNWIITFIILGIPLINLIMLIIWALGGTPHPSKKTFAQAFFVLLGISLCISILVTLLLHIFPHHKAVGGPVA